MGHSRRSSRVGSWASCLTPTRTSVSPSVRSSRCSATACSPPPRRARNLFLMATAEVAPDSQRAWWLRALMVLQAPGPVFAALRDDSSEAEDARSEPVTALVFLGGIAGVLLAPRFGRLYDDYALDGLAVLVTGTVAGSLCGFFSVYVLGWTLSLGVRAVGGEARARRCRHLLAFSVAPLALSLVIVWPLRLALYGGDLFRDGGSDSGAVG